MRRDVAEYTARQWRWAAGAGRRGRRVEDDAAHANRLGSAAPPTTTDPRTAAAPCPPAHAQRRRRDHRSLELTIPLHGDQRGEQGHAAQVVVRAVDGIDDPAGGGPARVVAVLLAEDPVVGERRADPVAEHPLDPGVGHGDERRVRLARDLHVPVEVLERQRIGGIAPVEGRLDPAPDLGLGAAAEGGGPCRPELGAHARILAPSGSYSGSRAISKPIQSPNTSTSPRVPIAAWSGGR